MLIARARQRLCKSVEQCWGMSSLRRSDLLQISVLCGAVIKCGAVLVTNPRGASTQHSSRAYIM
jgi:hypothetical protein